MDDSVVSITVTDNSGNSSNCSFTLSLLDTISPTISCPSSITEYYDSNCEFILSNIYYPRSPDYTRYYDIIEIWNDKLGKYAKNNGLKILNIDDKVDKKHYFTHDIEPSASGSSVIIDNILKL